MNNFINNDRRFSSFPVFTYITNKLKRYENKYAHSSSILLALMEAYAYNSENGSEEHRKTEQKSSECNHNTNQILETLSPNITKRITDSE